MIEVRPVTRRSDWRAFAKVPHEVYRDDPLWIPGDIADVKSTLIKPNEGVKRRIRTQAFVAYDAGRPVGRIVAIEDLVFIERYEERIGFFGFYEVIDDKDVAFALLDAAADWARGRDLRTMYGPLSPSLLYSAGFLVGGVDEPALVGMPHNPRYYADQVEAWGMRAAKDFHSYYTDDPHLLMQTPPFIRKFKLGQRWKERSKVTFRSMDPKTFDEDIELLRELYNASFAEFWGFTPVDRDEMLDLAKTMLPILDPELVLFAEIDAVPVAFMMAIPDVNKAAIHANKSRIGLLRDLHTYALFKGPRSKRYHGHVRVDMMAVHPDCPDPGTASLLIFELFERLHNLGYKSAEAAPVVDDGGWFRSVKASYPMEPNRSYRVYEKELF